MTLLFVSLALLLILGLRRFVRLAGCALLLGIALKEGWVRFPGVGDVRTREVVSATREDGAPRRDVRIVYGPGR